MDLPARVAGLDCWGSAEDLEGFGLALHFDKVSMNST